MNLNQYDRGDNGGRQKDRGGKDDFAGWVVIMARNLARGRWLVNSFEADVPGSLSFLRPVELSQGLICAHCLDSRSLRDGRSLLAEKRDHNQSVGGRQSTNGWHSSMWSPITCLGMECARKKGGRGASPRAKKGGGDIWRQKRPRTMRCNGIMEWQGRSCVMSLKVGLSLSKCFTHEQQNKNVSSI